MNEQEFPRRKALPPWLKKRLPADGAASSTAELLRDLGLATVCQGAKCPNIWECFSRKVATFMILGDRCTRNCRFCGVFSGDPLPPDSDEPKRVAEAVRKLVAVSQRATDWANEHPLEAAEVVARQLQATSGQALPIEATGAASGLEITPEVLLRSMARLDYTTNIDPQIVQATIDYIATLGYIKAGFNAGDILNLSFLETK